jgi:hypothetical protein
MHTQLGFFKASGSFFGASQGQLLLRLEHRQLFTECGQQGAVMPQVRFGLLTATLGLLQIVLQLAQALLAMLDALLHPSNVTGH